MKIYFAGGMPYMCNEERERNLHNKFKIKRLFSFYFKKLIYKSNIINIIRDANQ
jgi:hypothetical protein